MVCVHEDNGDFKLPLTPFEELNSKHFEWLPEPPDSSGSSPLSSQQLNLFKKFIVL